jgi:hypothetical protein
MRTCGLPRWPMWRIRPKQGRYSGLSRLLGGLSGRCTAGTSRASRPGCWPEDRVSVRAFYKVVGLAGGVGRFSSGFRLLISAARKQQQRQGHSPGAIVFGRPTFPNGASCRLAVRDILGFAGLPEWGYRSWLSPQLARLIFHVPVT